MKAKFHRFCLALRMFWKHGIGLRWTPQTAWYIAGVMMEMRQFCRSRETRQEGPWLVGRITDAD